MRRGLILTLVGLFAISIAGPGQAAPPGHVGIELNLLEPAGEACRIYIVVGNGTDQRFDTLKLDLVMFGSDDVIVRRLAVEAAPLPAGKTSLKVFDVEQLACSAIGRMLLNDVLVCAGQQGSIPGCLALVRTSTRTTVPFDL